MARLKALLTAAFNVRSGEGLPLFLLLVHSFAHGISMVFLETPASTLFLRKFSVAGLPYVYMLTAVVSTLLGYGYSRLETHLSRARLLLGTLGLISCASTALYLALWIRESSGLVMALMVWKEVAWVLSGIELWALVGLLLDVRQGKRLFALIGVGEVIAGIAGGLSVPLIVRITGTVNLLVFSVAGTLLSFFLLAYILKLFASRLASSRTQTEGEASSEPLRNLLREPYLRSFFTVSILACLAFYFIDYVFYDRVSSWYDDEMCLAGFFGIYYAGLSFADLISSAFLSGRLMMRYGLSFGLLALPVANALGTGSAIVTSVLIGSAAAFLCVVVANKVTDEVVRSSVQAHAFRVLYQPLPSARRLKIQALRESVVEPAAMGLSGAILLLLTSVFSFDAIQLLYVTLAIVAAWILLGLLLRREYTATLLNVMTRKRLRDLSITLEDPATLAIITKGLESPHPSEVLYCLHVLQANDHPSLNAHLVRLLEHADSTVRRTALGRIEDLRVTEARPRLMERLAREDSPEVLGHTLRALCAVGESEILDTVSSYLTSPEPRVKKGAIVGLLRSGGIDGVLIAGAHLNELLVSAIPADRALAAQVLGDVGIVNFFQPLEKLLRDEDLEVRKAALVAAAQVRNRKLLPLVMENLHLQHAREMACSTLVQFRDDAIPAIERAFGDGSEPREIRVRLAAICGHIQGRRAVEFLWRHIAHSDPAIRTQVLHSLVLCRHKAKGDQVLRTHEGIRREVDNAAWASACLEDLGPAYPDSPLTGALSLDIAGARDRAIALLSFLYPSETILEIKIRFSAGSTERRAGALELLDNLLSQDLKALTFPLLDDLTPRERLSRLAPEFPQRNLSPRERLREIIEASGHRASLWTRACALHAIGSSQRTDLGPTLVAALTDPEPIIRETAAWALHRSSRSLYRQHSDALKADPNEAVHRTARRLDSADLNQTPRGGRTERALE